MIKLKQNETTKLRYKEIYVDEKYVCELFIREDKYYLKMTNADILEITKQEYEKILKGKKDDI